MKIHHVTKKNMEMNNAKFKSLCIIFVFTLISINLCAQKRAEDKMFTLQIRGIGFESRVSRVSGDTMCLKPIIMYLDIDVINNTNEKKMLGSYNHPFNKENKKYGCFTLIEGQDTICLYSRQSSLNEIKPRQSISMQLEYEGNELLGNDPFLSKMAIVWIGGKRPTVENICISDIESVQQFIDSLQMGYIPFASGSFDDKNFWTQIHPELLFVDYIYNDNKVFSMRKSFSKWALIGTKN